MARSPRDGRVPVLTGVKESDMRFNPKARLDTSRVRDVGGSSGGGGGGGPMRIPIPGGTKAGGGIGGIIIILLIYVLTQCVGGNTPQLPNTGLDPSRMIGSDTGRYANCKTGADANNSSDCARVAVENSLVSYWSKALPAQSNAQFTPEAGVQTFSGGTNTGCGNATSEVGPFYCPVDQ